MGNRGAQTQNEYFLLALNKAQDRHLNFVSVSSSMTTQAGSVILVYIA